MIQHELTLATPLGPVRLAARGDGLVGLWFCGQKFEGPRTQGTGKPATETSAVLKQGARWLEAYFAGKSDPPAPTKLAAEGTAFQQQVWAGLK